MKLPPGFNYALASRNVKKPAQEWAALGVRRVRDQAFPNTQGYILAPAGARGPAFLMTRNFEVILRYNPADAYALAIGHLADRIRGGGPFEGDWPRGEQVLSRAERLELQERLSALGLYGGAIDGNSTRIPAPRSLPISEGAGTFPTPFQPLQCWSVCGKADSPRLALAAKCGQLRPHEARNRSLLFRILRRRRGACRERKRFCAKSVLAVRPPVRSALVAPGAL